MPEVNIPFFPGFYESMLSQELDHCKERYAEWDWERQAEDAIPPELRLDQNAFALFEYVDYRGAQNYLAKEWVASLENVLAADFDLKLKLTFIDMSSPRFYNFETDKVFVNISARSIKALFALSRRDKHKTLETVIKRRHSSRDGFISFYRNNLADWLEKPLAEWDHNELGTLLVAAMEIRAGGEDDRRDLQWRIFEGMSDNSDFDTALDRFTDWAKREEAIKEARADLEAELRAADPDYVAPEPRCPFTLDLFTDRPNA